MASTSPTALLTLWTTAKLKRSTDVLEQRRKEKVVGSGSFASQKALIEWLYQLYPAFEGDRHTRFEMAPFVEKGKYAFYDLISLVTSSSFCMRSMTSVTTRIVRPTLHSRPLLSQRCSRRREKRKTNALTSSRCKPGTTAIEGIQVYNQGLPHQQVLSIGDKIARGNNCAA